MGKAKLRCGWMLDLRVDQKYWKHFRFPMSVKLCCRAPSYRSLRRPRSADKNHICGIGHAGGQPRQSYRRPDAHGGSQDFGVRAALIVVRASAPIFGAVDGCNVPMRLTPIGSIPITHCPFRVLLRLALMPDRFTKATQLAARTL